MMMMTMMVLSLFFCMNLPLGHCFCEWGQIVTDYHVLCLATTANEK